ncbi:hypothetical protein ACFT8V_03935 [Streptomyces griseoincarnatus]
MSSQGADERRIRSHLIRMGVGPAATTQAPARRPAQDPSDAWWDKLYADDQPAAPARVPSPRLPDWWAVKPESLPSTEEAAPGTPAVTPPTSTVTPPAAAPGTPPKPSPARPAARRHTPPQSLLDAWDGIRPRTRWLIHHATAAAAGWPLGLVDWGTTTAAWYAAGNWTAPSAWVLYGLGLAALALYRRARTWAWPAAWATAIPVSSTVLGVLLYAPNP